MRVGARPLRAAAGAHAIDAHAAGVSHRTIAATIAAAAAAAAMESVDHVA